MASLGVFGTGSRRVRSIAGNIRICTTWVRIVKYNPVITTTGSNNHVQKAPPTVSIHCCTASMSAP